MRVITVARKPLEGTVARNALKWGCGGINIDATRIGTSGGTSRGSQAPYPKKEDGTEDRSGSWARTGHEIVEIAAGRWPANLVLCSEASNVVDSQSGDRPGFSGSGTTGAGFRVDYVHGDPKKTTLPATYYNDTGGASRFFKQIFNDEGDMTTIPQDLIDYLVTMISPPEPHPKAVFWDGLEGNLMREDGHGGEIYYKDNVLTGLILRPKSKNEPTEAQSKELLRILRPGAHLLMIAPDDQPTGHTAVCTVEDAGFEVRDAICWANEAGDGDRLHYVAKAARSEREAGCHDLPAKTGAEATDREEDTAGLNNPRAGAGRTAGSKTETQVKWKLRDDLSDTTRAMVKEQLLVSGLSQSLVESL